MIIHRHAYLILAHNNFYILEKLLKLLDDERNDIYLHLDKKSCDFDVSYFLNINKYSKIHLIQRKSILWADYSIVDVTLDLLEQSTNQSFERKYTYYHLLSGVDLPIKTQDEIHAFFKDNDNEYVTINKNVYPSIQNRVKTYNPFIKLPFYRKHKMIKVLGLTCSKVQLLFGINRLRRSEYPAIYNGSQWFSITDNLARYIIGRKENIKKIFDYTVAPDEVFVQTVTFYSGYKNKIFEFDSMEASLREIDWVRGKPYIFRNEDYESILASKSFFARKFDEKVCLEIVDRIFDTISTRQLKEVKS